VTAKQFPSPITAAPIGVTSRWAMIPVFLLFVLAGARTKADSDSAKELSGAIRRLGSQQFDARREAGDELLRAGGSAVPVLRKAASTSESPEIRYRASELLLRIERQLLELQIADILAGRPISGELPVWERYAEVVGTDRQARNLLAQMLERSPDLMLSIGGSHLQEQFDEAISDLLNPAFRRGSHPLTVPEAAVLLFAMSQPECQPTPATAGILVQYLNVANFRATLTGNEYGAPLRLILSGWVTRPAAGAPSTRLMLAQAYELPEGRTPALEIISAPIQQGQDAQSALSFLAKFGQREDLNAVEALLENKLELNSSRGTPRAVTTKVQDVALATLWKMNGENPVRHGMAGYIEDGGRPKLGNIGFADEESRIKAIAEWNAWRRARIKADLPPDGRAIEGQSA
jgi:hypothetical protein